jgi:hypothetical protein
LFRGLKRSKRSPKNRPKTQNMYKNPIFSKFRHPIRIINQARYQPVTVGY